MDEDADPDEELGGGKEINSLMNDTAWNSDDDPEDRQAELDRKERDNLDRIQKLLDKATCGHHGFLVYHDCVTARKRGTKYKNVGGMAKPCRTRKRFRSYKDLDMKLWAMCLGKETHVFDKLILSQMLPGYIPEQIADQLHKIRKHFGMEADCNCGKKADAYEIGDEKELTQDLDKEIEVGIFQFCTFHETSFVSNDLNCKRIHLASHLKDKLISNPKSKTCDKFGSNVGRPRLMVGHLALAHKAVDQYFEIDKTSLG